MVYFLGSMCDLRMVMVSIPYKIIISRIRDDLHLLWSVGGMGDDGEVDARPLRSEH